MKERLALPSSQPSEHKVTTTLVPAPPNAFSVKFSKYLACEKTFSSKQSYKT